MTPANDVKASWLQPLNVELDLMRLGLVPAACLMALTACRLGTGADEVTVRLSSAQQTLPQGGTGGATLTVTNGSARSITISVQNCPYYGLIDGKGRVIPAYGLICPAIAYPPIIVQAGETYSREGQWLVNMFAGPAEHGKPQPLLATGRYLLSSQVLVDGAVRLATSPVEITPAND
ncbi:MAG: hypothetical protein H7066_00585 [Cytophagaceae bacterium]|nr:hypothetical protein [Gemmatimonadaceae bacterium]